jgi:uncharacterized protein (DUF4213/DUF364 family)
VPLAGAPCTHAVDAELAPGLEQVVVQQQGRGQATAAEPPLAGQIVQPEATGPLMVLTAYDAPMALIADALLSDLARRLGNAPTPRVKALHLPPLPWNGSKDGEFGALELDDGSLGLSYVLLDGSLGTLADGQAAVELPGAGAMDLAAGWLGGDAAARTLGFAAVNALSRHVLDRMGFVPPDAPDSIGGLDPQPGEHIGMVGLFPPLVRQVTARGARLTVLELRADLAGEHAGFTVTLDPKDLNACDKVLSTSTVLLNHTLEVVLANCHKARHIALIGPGAGCLPDELFKAGVTTLGGTWITDASGFKRALSQGQPWGSFARKFAWNAADWLCACIGESARRRT